MTIYVDDMNQPYGRMIMSHMFCHPVSAVEELRQMADALGLNRKWFQHKKAEFPHYDVSFGFKQKAIKLGAVSITTREMVKIVQDRRVNDEQADLFGDE